MSLKHLLPSHVLFIMQNGRWYVHYRGTERQCWQAWGRLDEFDREAPHEVLAADHQRAVENEKIVAYYRGP